MLINRPILSLRTGTEVAIAMAPLINPNNLKIEGFFCHDTRSRETLILVSQDVRDIISQGIVVNDHDVLAQPQELVRLREVINTNFEILGKQVVTNSGGKLGKVGDYAFDTGSMFIQKLYVTQSLFKNISGGSLGVDRTQIIEITNKKVVVSDLTQKVTARAGAIA
jgi:uncharacterized protein YrrD